jgi:lysophospholipase L1-like esterase
MTMAATSVTILSPEKAAATYATRTEIKGAAVRAGFAVIGDSITAFNSSGGDVWHKVLTAMSGGRLPWRGYFATGGFTLAQIEETHLPSALALTRRPGAVVIAGGTNDTGSATFNQTESRATLLRIIGKLQAAGIMPVLWTLPPRDDSAAVNTLVQKWNVWVRYLAHSLGLPIIDAHAALTDPATGLYLAGLKTDSVHPNRAGHFQIGRRAGTDPDFLRRFPSGTPHLSDSKLDAANLIPSGYAMFDSGVNGAGVPTGWTGYGQNTAYTPSIVADDAVPGNWFRMTKAAGVTGGGGLQYNLLPAGGWAVGDTLALAVRFKQSTPDSGTEAISSIGLVTRAAGVVVGGQLAYASGGTFESIAYAEAVVTSTIDTVRLDMSLSGTPAAEAWLQVAQPTIVNLTALGIA